MPTQEVLCSSRRVGTSFEDKNRTEAACDNDFNDVVIYSTIEKS